MQVNTVFVLVGIYAVDLSLIYTSNTIEDRKDFVIHTEAMGEGIQYKQTKKIKESDFTAFSTGQRFILYEFLTSSQSSLVAQRYLHNILNYLETRDHPS